MSPSTGVQVRAFPQLLPGNPLNPLRPPPGPGVDAPSAAFLSPTGVDLGQGHPAASNWQDSLFLFLAIFFFFWLLSI